MAVNRLLNFHVVRSTILVHFTPTDFVPDDIKRMRRSETHRANVLGYPDPKYHMNSTQQYFFRNRRLWHLRIEQFNRYFCTRKEYHGEAALSGESLAVQRQTVEDTIDV